MVQGDRFKCKRSKTGIEFKSACASQLLYEYHLLFPPPAQEKKKRKKKLTSQIPIGLQSLVHQLVGELIQFTDKLMHKALQTNRDLTRQLSALHR